MTTYNIYDLAVFVLVESAAAAIEIYLDTHNKDPMLAALAALKDAQPKAAQNPAALNYRAIIEDLLGNYSSALEHFTAVESAARREGGKVLEEVRLNFNSVVYQSARRETALHLAEQPLNKEVEVALSAVFPSERKKVWRAHRDALLARFLALQCIPALPEDAHQENREARQRLEQSYNATLEQANNILNFRRPFVAYIYPPAIEGWRQAMALARDARARAGMYHTDYFIAVGEKLPILADALQDLLRVTRTFPEDWSYRTDLGSCYMRLGYWAKDKSETGRALSELELVVEKLRFDYGLALFETGRVYRLNGEFNKAAEYLGRSQKIPEKDRDISDARIARELRLNNQELTVYP